MDYISAVEVEKNEGFQNRAYKNVVKKTVYRELKSLAVCERVVRNTDKPKDKRYKKIKVDK